jgi:threonine synthase
MNEGVWRYASLLPPVASDARVTIGEGNTPLVPSRRVGPEAGFRRLVFKLDALNPTGSYKDRFAVLALSAMRARGEKHCLGTSSGNSGAALAATGAAGSIPCTLLLVEGAPAGKLTQMGAYGARLVTVRGFGHSAETTHNVMELLKERSERGDAALQISAFTYSPTGMAGVQTLAWELAEQCPQALDRVFLPVGGGGFGLAVARGFEAPGRPASPSPAIHCVQPEGNDTLATPLREGAARAQSVSCTTRISGLQVPNVIDDDELLVAARRSGGTGHAVSDERILEAHRRLHREEGISCEPAGAAALAGALDAAKEGTINPDETVVCIVTGSGFKDPASLEAAGGPAPPVCDAEELPSMLDA